MTKKVCAITFSVALLFLVLSCSENRYQAEDPEIRSSLKEAEAFIDSGFPGDALPLLNQILNSHPKSVAALTLRGELLFSAKQGQASWEDFQKAYVIEPSSELMNLSAQSSVLLGEFDRAQREYETAIKLSPNDPIPLLGKGKLLLRLGLPDKAITTLSLAIKIDDRNPEIWFSRGLAHYRAKNFNQALDDLDESIDGNDENLIAFNTRGLVKVELSRYASAIEDFDQAIGIQSDYVDAYINRGSAYGTLGNHELAASNFAHVIHLRPNDSTGYTNRGLAFLRLDLPEQALIDLDKAVKVNPLDPIAYAWRGVAHAILGNATETKQNIQRALDLGIDKALLQTFLETFGLAEGSD